MKKLTLIGAVLAAVLGLNSLAQPAAATSDTAETPLAAQSASGRNPFAVPLTTFGTFEMAEDEDGIALQVGSNLLLAGNQVVNQTTVRGILFAFGYSVDLDTSSEYAFVAGNAVTFANTRIEKDVFVAGNSIRIERTAELGRDVYAAADSVILNADLQGDFSASAEVVTLDNVKIDGDVDLAVSRLIVTGDKVEITGNLVINADAEIVRRSNVFEYKGIEKYEVARYEIAPAAAITVKTVSILGLFVVMLIILLVFPCVNKKVDQEISGSQMVVDMLLGFCMLVLVPILCVFLLLTVIASPAAFLLLAAYIIMIYIAQGFSGLWLGKLIVERIFGWEGNKLFEALLGIVILGFASLAPVVGGWIGFFSLLLGLGLIIQSIRNKQVGKNINWGPRDGNDTVAEAEVVKPKKTKSIKTRKTSASKATTKKSKTVKEED